MHNSQVAAELQQDRIELLRLRTLLVGFFGILCLVVSLVLLSGFGRQTFTFVGQWINDTAEFHVPNNMFLVAPNPAWARTPVLLQLGFAAIGFGGVIYMTQQVLGEFQKRLWLLTMCILAMAIFYSHSNTGSIWHTKHRELVKAVRAGEWDRVEEFASKSPNPDAKRYVMAQVGLIKKDSDLLEQHGKVLIDEIDAALYSASVGTSLLKAADDFNPRILKNIDVAVFGAAHSQIGLVLTQSPSAEKKYMPTLWLSFLRSIVATALAMLGVGLSIKTLQLWRHMSNRHRRLKYWLVQG